MSIQAAPCSVIRFVREALHDRMSLLFWRMFMNWGQARFIRQTLAAGPPAGNERVIASLTTLPDRIQRLEPTIRSLLNQPRPPNPIVLAIPEFAIRQKRPYAIPKYLSEFPTLRILHCQTDWG